MGILDFFGKFGKDPLTPKQAAAKQKLLSELDRLGQEVKLRKTLVEAAIREEKPVTLGHLDEHNDIVRWCRDLFRGTNLTNAMNLAGELGIIFINLGTASGSKKLIEAKKMKKSAEYLENADKAINALKKLVESV